MSTDWLGKLEARLRPLTEPVGGQYPRPWMTGFDFRHLPRVLIVGFNQATAFSVDKVAGHEVFLDALFNRNGQSMHALYAEVRGDHRASPTRCNLNKLSDLLAKYGADDVLETNVVCYSTAKGADLKQSDHREGVRRGKAIFDTVLDGVRPQVLIVHGVETRKELIKVFGQALPELSERLEDGVRVRQLPLDSQAGGYRPQVFVVQSLAAPWASRWQSWRDEHLAAVCAKVVAVLEPA